MAQKNISFALKAVAILAFLAVAIGVLILGWNGINHRRAIDKCKTLLLGMTEQEIITGLELMPVVSNRVRQGEMNIEILVFEPGWIISSLQAQGIYISIDLPTKHAVEIVCDENFRLVDPRIKEMNKKGIFKKEVKNLRKT